jgi:hypothetical protein
LFFIKMNKHPVQRNLTSHVVNQMMATFSKYLVVVLVEEATVPNPPN